MEKEDADVAHTSSPDQSLWLDWSFGPGRQLSAVMSSQAGDLMGAVPGGWSSGGDWVSQVLLCIRTRTDNGLTMQDLHR